MADNPTELNIGNLTSLANEAKAGQLVLDPAVAQECATACEGLIGSLDAIRQSVGQLDRLLPLGDFNCANDLATALRDLAVGPGGFRQRLDEHTEAVKQIHDMVGASVTALVTSDSDHSQAINSAGSQVAGS